MNRFFAMVLLAAIFLSGCGASGETVKESPFEYFAYTVKEIGAAAMKQTNRVSNEPYAYEVTLYNGETKLDNAEMSTRVVLPYAMFDINYGTKALEKYNNLTVLIDENGKLTPVCARYVRALEGVEMFVNKSGTYVAKDNPVKLTSNDDFAAPAEALIARGVMTEQELNSGEPLTWDDLDKYIARIYNTQSGIITRCGFDEGRFKSGKKISLQDTAVVVYNAMNPIRVFTDPKELTHKKVSSYAKQAVSVFEELGSITSSMSEIKNPVSMQKLAAILGRAYFMPGKGSPENVVISQPGQKSNLNGVEAYAPVAGLENSTEYSVEINGTPVACQKNRDIAIARFAVTGPFKVQISANHDITGLTISPLTLGIVPKIYKNTIEF